MSARAIRVNISFHHNRKFGQKVLARCLCRCTLDSIAVSVFVQNLRRAYSAPYKEKKKNKNAKSRKEDLALFQCHQPSKKKKESTNIKEFKNSHPERKQKALKSRRSKKSFSGLVHLPLRIVNLKKGHKKG